MAWLCIVGSLTYVYCIQNGSLIDMQYGCGSLGSTVLPFAGALGPEFIFYDR